MSAMKLQKLVYYSQAWSLVWDDTPLFDDEIQAWAHGPVVPSLYAKHRGQFTLQNTWAGGDASNLRKNEMETIDAVLSAYGHLTAGQLSALTHSEDPWIIARKGLPPGARGEEVIEHSDMAEFYAGQV